MTLRAAGRLVVALAVVTLTAVGVAGGIDLEAALHAPTQAMGSKVEHRGQAASATSDVAHGLIGEDATFGSPGTTASTGAAAEAGSDGGAGVWAVVIGIDDYPGSGRDLRAGVADAGDMVATLDAFRVPPSQRQVLLDGAATIPAVRSALDWLALSAGPRSTALVFFSGHVRQVRGDPDADGEDVDEVMVLADDGTITDGELKGFLDRTPARRTWVVMASCYSGGFDDVMAPGRVLTAAAPEGVLAYENDGFDRTYLVEYMVRRALLGGMAWSVQDAFNWAVEALRKDYPHRLPVIFDQTGEPLILGPPIPPSPVVEPTPASAPEIGLPPVQP